jgi:DNA-binding NarL/FixJ family response regulator
MIRRPPKRTLALASQYESIGSLIRHYVCETTEIAVTWETTSAREALALCEKQPPNVLIISPFFRDATAPHLAHSIREMNPDIRILLFAGVLHEDLVHQMIAAEVHGIVSAHSPLPTLLTAIDILLNHGCYFDGVAETYFHSSKPVCQALSKRENSVLRLVATGLSTKEVASELGIGVKTAEKFRERIMKKLNLHDVVKLTRYAIRNGISSLD